VGVVALLLVAAIESVSAMSSVAASGSQGGLAVPGAPLLLNGTLGPLTLGGELPSLRTAHSDTYLASDGSKVLQVFAQPVNYQTSPGVWSPINDQLTSNSDGSASATATPAPVTLPHSLSSAVSVGSAAAGVSFRLLGGAGTAALSGQTATYTNALPGVNASYEALSTGLKETLTLASASAPATYRFALSTSGGLTAHQVGGAVEFVDAGGAPRYIMPAPFVQDSSSGSQPDPSAVAYSLSADGSTLTVSISPTWLSSSARVFPVTLDPTVTLADAGDCSLISGPEANTPQCSDILYVGSQASPAETARTGVIFSLTSIPTTATVTSAQLSLTLNAATTSAETIDAYALTRLATDPDWNTYDGTHAWTTPGGDYSSTLQAQTVVPASAAAGAVESFAVTSLAQSWVQSPSTNYGVLLKQDNEANDIVEGFKYSNGGNLSGGPALQVQYTSGPVNTGLPTVSGTPLVGSVLTASTGTWSGSPTSYAYQWSYSTTSGGTYTAISGATSSSYTIPSTYAGDFLKVTVTATDANNNSTSATSAATTMVPPYNTVAPTVSGTAKVGSVLTAANGTWVGTPTSFTYQWSYATTSGGTYTPISGATSSTYTIAQAYAFDYLKVTVTGVNAGGPGAGASSAAAGPVASVPVNTGPPVISGTVLVGSALTASGVSRF
jgi:hypothetical protein